MSTTRQAIFEAYWDTNTHEVTVVRSIPAGISGPFGPEFVARDEVEMVLGLANQDLALAGEWSEVSSGGCRSALLVEVTA